MRLTLKNNVMYLPDGEEICDVSLELIRAAPDMLLLLEQLADENVIENKTTHFECMWCGHKHPKEALMPEACEYVECASNQIKEMVARASGTSQLRCEAIFRAQDPEFAAKLVACVDEVTLNLLVKGEADNG
jgi:hypothetical protein